MVRIRIFEFWKKSQAVNQFSKSIRSRNLWIMYRKLSRSTSVFRFTFRYKSRGFAIIDISYFSQRYRKFKRKKCPHLYPPPPMRSGWPNIAIWQACVLVCCVKSLYWVWVHCEYATSNVLICWFQYVCTGHSLTPLFATIGHIKLCISFSLIILRNMTFFQLKMITFT